MSNDVIYDFTVKKPFQERVLAYLVLIGPFAFGLFYLKSHALDGNVLSASQIDILVNIGIFALLYWCVSLFFKLRQREGVVVRKNSLELVSLLPVTIPFSEIKGGTLCLRRKNPSGYGQLQFFSEDKNFAAPCSDWKTLTEFLRENSIQVLDAQDVSRRGFKERLTKKPAHKPLSKTNFGELPLSMKILLIEIVFTCAVVSTLFMLLFFGQIQTTL